MKKVLVKIPAVFGMLLTLLSLFLYVNSFIFPDAEYWEVSVYVALFSFLFYFIDAIISFVKAILKRDTIFNFILTAALIIAVPFLIFIGGANIFLNHFSWNVYYLLIFVLEVVSIVRCAKAK